MSILLICPDYASHYLPLVSLGETWRSAGEEVVVATGPELAERVCKDGFLHVRLTLGQGGNAGLIRPEREPPNRLAANLEAVRGGMICTLRFQAEGRLRDLLWRPLDVAAAIYAIVEQVRPRFVVVVQMCYNATVALMGLRIPFATFVTGHPAQFPTISELYGFPYFYPPRFRPDPGELNSLEQLCREVQRSFTAEFNAALSQVDRTAVPVPNAFAAASPELLLFNYPAELAEYRRRVMPEHARFLGSTARAERLDPELDRWLRVVEPDLPVIYVSLGSFFSVRADVLDRIVTALRSERVRVLVACGVADPDSWGPIPGHWMIRTYFPQPAVLPYCSAVICHAGNNTVTEAFSAGVPLVVGPFSSDQFSSAYDVERNGLGAVFDPNGSSSNEIRELVRHTSRARSQARRLGERLRAALGPAMAANLCNEVWGPPR